MVMKIKVLITSVVLALSLASLAEAQVQAAAATPVAATQNTPSIFQVRQNFFSIEQANINRSLRQVERCLANASMPQVLRDPEGNINRVPSVDIVDCTYQLQLLQRQLARLARAQVKDAQDASAAAMLLQFQQQRAQAQRILQALSGTPARRRIR